MNLLEAALLALHDAFDVLSLPYMVIGGLANAQWGVPRATVDVDLTVWAEESAVSKAVDALCTRFPPLPQDPRSFVQATRVLPLDVGGIRADVLFGLLPFEREAIRRAVCRTVSGRPIRFCTAEDLILLKVVSERERDLEDVRGILKVQRGKLDTAYLEPRLRELAALLDRPGIWEDYLRWR